MNIEDLTIDEINFEKGVVEVHWSANIGFGVYTLYMNGGKLYAETECMDKEDDKEFTKMIFDRLYEMVNVVE